MKSEEEDEEMGWGSGGEEGEMEQASRGKFYPSQTQRVVCE